MSKNFRAKWIFSILLCAGMLSALNYLTASVQDNSFIHEHGHMLFLLQQGQHEQALKLYQNYFQTTGKHDFELLHQIGLRILDYGFRENDPECQLMSLFGASVSAHEDAYYILEESVKSRFPPIQLVALGALAQFQNDRADQALSRALGAAMMEIRFEAVHQLCKKKHFQAVNQAESLMYKSPIAAMPLYPPLFAMVGDSQSTRILRKLLNHTSSDVRLAVILSAAKYHRDDLLPQIRQQSAQLQFALQEACAAAFGILKDETSISRLERLSTSQYPTVALAAQLALYQLGRIEVISTIENAASKGDLYAIAALGSIPNHPRVLLEQLENSNIQIRFNAMIALLKQRHSRALEVVDEVIIRDKRDLAFTSISSPGKSLSAWKITSSANQLLKDDVKAYYEHLELKEVLLNRVRELSLPHFMTLAHLIFSKQQNDLVPHVVQILEDLGNEAAIQCLKQHQQQLGAPLVRHYCNLALIRLQEPGPYAEQLRQWIKTQNETQFISFKPFVPWELEDNAYTLTPEENSKLLIKTFETFANQQDTLGVETLIEAMATGHKKNKYALAGLLLRATQ